MTTERKTKGDMTEGPPLRLLFTFAVPLVIGNVFQQLYTVTDTAIVGQGVGLDALAALGAVDWFNWMALGIVQGVTQGFSILIAQCFGAGDREGLRRANGCSVALALAGSLLLTGLAQLMVAPAMAFLKIPQEISPIAEAYLRIMYAGIPLMAAYNMGSSMLRAVGDSRTPLVAMALASLTNIGLDLIFVLVFHWGVEGAAVATLLAQTVAALYCAARIRRVDTLGFSREDLRPRAALAKRLLILGLPMAFQNTVIAVGGMVLQSVVNGHGVAFIAGFTATNKLYGVLEIAAVSYGYAMTTYTGQNLGAGRPDRISRGVRAGNVLGLLTAALICAVMLALGRTIVSVFIDTAEAGSERAVDVAARYLAIMSVCLPVLYILHVTRSCIQGMGNTVIPMVSGLMEFVMRTGAAFLLPRYFGEEGILWAEVTAWAGAVCILIPGYFLVRRRVGRMFEQNGG